MARPEKVAAVDEVKENLTGSVATLLTDFRGLSVTEMGELRGELRKANARYKVVKNTLTLRAADAAGIDGLDTMLTGPTALVFCDEDPVGPAKALRAFSRAHPQLLIKGGYLDGQVLDDQSASRLADLESREELLARVAGLFYGALANFARLLQAPVEQQARLLQALIDDGGAEAKGFEPTTDGVADSPAVAEDAGEAVETAAEVAEEATAAAAQASDDAAADAAATAGDAAATAAAAAAEATGSDVVADAAEAVAGAVETAAETAAGVAEDAVSSVAGAASSAVERVTEAVTGGTDDAEDVDDLATGEASDVSSDAAPGEASDVSSDAASEDDDTG